MGEASDDVEPGLRLLSLDGGGIRGLSELIILEEIMGRITADKKAQGHPLTEPLRPCEYFDLIAGTSTGGLIALMLGRLGMTVEEALKKYGEFSKDIFYKRKLFWQDGSYKATKLKEAVCKTVQEYGIAEDEQEKLLSQAIGRESCKVFVCATPARNIQVGRPRRLRSYHVRSNPGYEGCTIWEAARATTAAPTYFKSISIGPDNARKEDFIDGGVGCNNPIQQILDEVRAAFGAERFVSCVISIGTGIPKVTDLKKSTTLTKIIPINAINALAKVATECQNASREVGNRFKDVPDFYFRFNVEQGLQDTEMDEWENQNDVVVHTRAYLLDASESVDKAVKALHARPRRLKASDIDGSVTPKPLNLRRSIPSSIPLFTGRENILSSMGTFFFSEPTSKRSKIFVLYGLGGVGKSQIAFEFAHRHATKFEEEYFIDASSKDVLESSLRDILPEHIAGPTASKAKLWLESQKNNCLLLFDNANQPNIDLGQYMPRSSHGNIIITSRNEETRHYGPRSNMDVSSFSETEATDLLLSASMLDIADEENRRLASEISRKLGNLPLAIMQAGAYIATHGELATYLTAYEKKRMELWNAKLDQSVDDYAYTVYTTWEMSMNMLAAPAQDFLRVCSFFHNVGISTDMFRTPFEIFRSLAESMLRNAATVNPTLPFVSESIGQFVTHPSFKNTMEFLDRFADSDGEWHPLAFGNLMGALRRYSMISGSGQHLYSIHSLVHQWTRFRTPDEEKDNYRGIALNIISGISFGSHYRLISLLFLYDLLPHLDAVLSIIELEGENLLLSHLLCLRHAFCRCEKWPSVEKIDLLGLRIVEHLPEDDPNRLYHQSLLVQSLFYMGKLEQSEALVVDTYEKSRQCNVLGPNHELTISCLSNQAMVVEQQGRWKDAGMLQARVLTAMLSNSSRETNIIKAMGNLACSLHRFGAYMQAEALRIVVFFVGYVAWTQDQCNEADVLVSMTNLSITLQRLRRNIPVEYCLKAIRRYGKIAGHTHPSCLETIFQIAALYSGSNQHNLAEAILHYSEKSILEVWGPESSQAILLKIHLATAHVGQGKLERAISELTPLFVRLSKTEAQLDVDRLLTTAFNLGIVLEVKGLLKQAEEVYQNVINRLEALSDQNLIYVTIEDQLRSVQDRISAGITEDAADSAGHTQPVRMEETLRQYSREDVEKLFSDDAENETLSYEDLLRECLKMRPDVVALIRRNECDTIQLCRLVFAA